MPERRVAVPNQIDKETGKDIYEATGLPQANKPPVPESKAERAE
jgi:hypothetical protein